MELLNYKLSLRFYPFSVILFKGKINLDRYYEVHAHFVLDATLICLSDIYLGITYLFDYWLASIMAYYHISQGEHVRRCYSTEILSVSEIPMSPME